MVQLAAGCPTFVVRANALGCLGIMGQHPQLVDLAPVPSPPLPNQTENNPPITDARLCLCLSTESGGGVGAQRGHVADGGSGDGDGDGGDAR